MLTERQIRKGLRVGAVALGCVAPLAICAQEKITYQDHILPLVENNCAKCHNPDKKKGDLDLTSYSALMAGGGSGKIVVAGDPDGSKMNRVVNHLEEPNMPPNKPKLPDKELAMIKKWIAGGLLENNGSKAIPAGKPTIDLALKSSSIGKPEGPPPMPQDLPLDPVVHTPQTSALVGLAGSPWAPLVAVAGQKQVLLHNSDTLELLGVLPFAEGQPWDLKFSRNGKLLLAGGGRGGKSGRVVVWDVVTGDKIMTVGEEYDTVLAADLRPDQTQLAMGGPGRLVKIHSTKTGELLFKLKKHTDWVNALAYSPDGEKLATADRNGGISMWDPDNGQELHTLAGHKASVTALCWRDDSRVLASASEDGSIKVWESEEGKQAQTWTAHSSGVLWVNYSHDGRLVTCGRDNLVIVWNGNGNKIKSFDAGELPVRAAFTHDGQRVIVTDWTGKVTAWNATNATRLGELVANPPTIADQLAAARKRVDELQKSSKSGPDLEEAKARLAQLNAAQCQSSVYRAREGLAALKREHEKLAAIAESSGKKADKAAAEKLAKQMASDRKQLDKMTADLEKLKSTSVGVVKQSKL